MMQAYEPQAGESIEETCAQLERLANVDSEARAEFNGVTIVAKQGMTAGDLHQTWRAEMDANAEAYRNSPEGIASAKRAGEFKRKAAESASLGIVTFSVSDSDAWEKWCKSNKDGAYGKCCLRYAARWANLMDSDIAAGKTLEEVAEQRSHDADTEGITGFMYGAAVSMLASCWTHGELLRQWHNKDVQIGT